MNYIMYIVPILEVNICMHSQTNTWLYNNEIIKYTLQKRRGTLHINDKLLMIQT